MTVVCDGSVKFKDILAVDGVEAIRNIEDHNPDAEEEPDEPEHKFEVGDFALDKKEPTPSPEVNTVEIVEVFDKRADEFVIEETGKTVAEHIDLYGSPDDLVVAGVYPHMGSEKVWHFPESRLQKT